jgi:hypothetical protein
MTLVNVKLLEVRIPTILLYFKNMKKEVHYCRLARQVVKNGGLWSILLPTEYNSF